MCDGELVGDPALKITGAASLAEATAEEITFYTRHVGALHKTRASAVFVARDLPSRLLLLKPRLKSAKAECRACLFQNRSRCGGRSPKGLWIKR